MVAADPTRPADAAARVQALEQKARDHSIVPFWTVVSTAHPDEPISRLQPFVWRWPILQDLLDEACAVVDTTDGKAERRAYTMLNPGLGGRYATTHTLIAGVQKMLPGEIAGAHRHTPDALRFIIEGEGAYTVVEGEKIVLHAGDLVLTPNWKLHDHGNAADGQAVTWMDALDVPLVNLLDASFFEQFPGRSQTVSKPFENSHQRYGVGHLKPTWDGILTGGPSPLLVYRWEQTEAALRSLARVDADPCDDVAMQYVNPFTGGSVLPTIDCWIQMLRPGVHTRAHRHTSTAVYFVVRGRGCSIINGRRYDWSDRDFVVLPNWAWHEHVNLSDAEDAILFSIQDRPVLQALGLLREQVLETNDGYQGVESASAKAGPAGAH
jgi:gentisate 1,2-dioxygenase